MQSQLLDFSFLALFVALTPACSNDDGGGLSQRTSVETKKYSAESVARHCFSNAHAFDDGTGAKDIEELVVVIDGTRAIGEYNWIPAYKDRRLGRFDGLFENGSITARYSFEQEGQSGTTVISIMIAEKHAIVSGEPPELGLDSTLARVDC